MKTNRKLLLCVQLRSNILSFVCRRQEGFFPPKWCSSYLHTQDRLQPKDIPAWGVVSGWKLSCNYSCGKNANNQENALFSELWGHCLSTGVTWHFWSSQQAGDGFISSNLIRTCVSLFCVLRWQFWLKSSHFCCVSRYRRSFARALHKKNTGLRPHSEKQSPSLSKPSSQRGLSWPTDHSTSEHLHKQQPCTIPKQLPGKQCPQMWAQNLYGNLNNLN